MQCLWWRNGLVSGCNVPSPFYKCLSYVRISPTNDEDFGLRCDARTGLPSLKSSSPLLLPAALNYVCGSGWFLWQQFCQLGQTRSIMQNDIYRYTSVSVGFLKADNTAHTFVFCLLWLLHHLKSAPMVASDFVSGCMPAGVPCICDSL